MRVVSRFENELLESLKDVEKRIKEIEEVRDRAKGALDKVDKMEQIGQWILIASIMLIVLTILVQVFR